MGSLLYAVTDLAQRTTLFFKFSGPNKVQVENDIKVVSEIVNKHKGGKFKYAKTEVEKEELWEGRKVRKVVELGEGSVVKHGVFDSSPA